MDRMRVGLLTQGSLLPRPSRPHRPVVSRGFVPFTVAGPRWILTIFPGGQSALPRIRSLDYKIAHGDPDRKCQESRPATSTGYS
jgi:hypothetical protein